MKHLMFSKRDLNQKSLRNHSQILMSVRLTMSRNLKNTKKIKVSSYKKCLCVIIEETFDRNKTYFILEKYFEKTKNDIKNKPENEPLSKAQQAILEYFDNPENIQFFERNKIQ